MSMHIKRKGISLNVDVDYSYNNRSPREDDNLGVMACYHSRYSLGDEDVPKTYEEFKEWYNANKDKVACILPLYLYDHSGLRMSVNDFNDRWDSGQVGWIYCTHEALKQYGISDKSRSEIAKLLINEVEAYDEYLVGEPYYYFCLRDEDDNIIDSVTGFKSDNIDDFFKEMKEYVDEKYYFVFDALLKKQKENQL